MAFRQQVPAIKSISCLFGATHRRFTKHITYYKLTRSEVASASTVMNQFRHQLLLVKKPLLQDSWLFLMKHNHMQYNRALISPFLHLSSEPQHEDNGFRIFSRSKYS